MTYAGKQDGGASLIISDVEQIRLCQGKGIIKVTTDRKGVAHIHVQLNSGNVKGISKLDMSKEDHALFLAGSPCKFIANGYHGVYEIVAYMTRPETPEKRFPYVSQSEARRLDEEANHPHGGIKVCNSIHCYDEHATINLDLMPNGHLKATIHFNDDNSVWITEGGETSEHFHRDVPVVVIARCKALFVAYGGHIVVLK